MAGYLFVYYKMRLHYNARKFNFKKPCLNPCLENKTGLCKISLDNFPLWVYYVTIRVDTIAKGLACASKWLL